MPRKRLRVKLVHLLFAALALSMCLFPLRDWLAARRRPMSAITASVPTDPTGTAGDAGLAIAAAARSQIGRTVNYDPSYARLSYPLGDVPIETGVCTDVIVRALRDALGMDLQQLVHEDMRAAFLLYPRRWGLKLPDSSIDHRRTLNLMRYFERKGFSVGVSGKPEDYLPGDIVTWGSIIHIMIVSDRKNEQGVPLVIHNIGGGAREEDALFQADITGHYRMTHKGKQSRLNNVAILASAAAIIGAAATAWRRRGSRST
ncbi:MAG: DUF1287 domain-containing protein [Kiritimatiellaeota bacterium]|nr:DUF1287 domain-containing protein [Kiritimatiellota bacterium]